jgi:quinol monooxygenase YgiN
MPAPDAKDDEAIDDNAPVVLINVFKCDARHQDELMAHLAALVQVQTTLPGFVSAALHRGLNGRVAANRAVWASADHWKAMTRHPDIVAAMGPILAIATFEPHLYEPGETVEA